MIIITDSIRTVSITAKEKNSDGSFVECSAERTAEIVFGKDHHYPYSQIKKCFCAMYVDWHLQGINDNPGIICTIQELPVIDHRELTDI